jgi:hypothetical protein
MMPTYETCINNNQTTWTYNQGVILSGLALLYNATGNVTLIDIAQNIADATIQHLTYSNGILKETCEPTTCDNDQQLFKGIFIRHLNYLLPYLTDRSHIDKYRSFLMQNAASVWTTRQCEHDGLFSLIWNNQTSSSCQSSRNAATTSSACDLFLSVINVDSRISNDKLATSDWILLGLGNCMDTHNCSMSNFYKNDIDETVCRTTATTDPGAIAYDYQLSCEGKGFCRIRTQSDVHHTPTGWKYETGSAHDVTLTNKSPLTKCFLRVK